LDAKYSDKPSGASIGQPSAAAVLIAVTDWGSPQGPKFCASAMPMPAANRAMMDMAYRNA
jgi:hypothetical protein